jgi:uncharacterized protein (TIGR02996 family)
MDTEETLLRAIHGDPSDDTARLALADHLEEQEGAGRAAQGELLRLHVGLRRGLPGDEASQAFERLQALLARGVRPVVPALRNSFGMLFVLIPPGTFRMGSPPQETDRFTDEGPERAVRISWAFYLGAYPVTQAEYEAVVGHNPSHFRANGAGGERVGDADTRRHPVENLSCDNAVRFCRALADAPEEKSAHRVYRLPSEAEWEYACRAGISGMGPFHFGRSLSSTQANFDGRHPYGGAPPGPYLRVTTPVGAYPPNAFGLFDMHGNVSEWCSDWFAEDYYRSGQDVDPRGPEQGEYGVLRGGAWSDDGKYCRAAFRYDRPPHEGRNDFGARVVLEHEPS